MTRSLVALALLVAGLLALERALPEDRRDAERQPRLVRLVELAGVEDAVVAGVTLESPRSGARFVYARSKGRWRCLTAWNAPCVDARVQALVGGLVAARGVLRDPGLADGADWGFEDEPALELTLHGKAMLSDPAMDAILRVRFGAATTVAGAAAGGGAFARRAGEDELLELDFDPRALVGDAPARGWPPLLDERLAPFDFPPPGARIEQAYLERSDGASLELARRPREARAPGPDVPPEATLPWEWILLEGERQTTIPPLRGEAWVTWITKAPYVALEDPRQPAAAGLDSPRARITLVASEGEPLVLEVGDALPGGGTWVANRAVPLLVAVDAATERMLLPDAAQLSDSTRPNEWDRWLREHVAARAR